jgi:hypothetical protein
MAILTRAFKTTVAGSTDLFVADTDLILIGITKTNGTATISIGIFDANSTRFENNITLNTAYGAKINVPVMQGSIIRYTTITTADIVTLTYYYDDVSNDTINPVGVWNSTTTYAKNNIVYRDTNNISYIANASNINKPPESNSGFWQIVSSQGTTLNVTLSSELTSSTSGLINGSTTTLGVGSTLTNKTLSGTTRFSNNIFYDSTGTYTYTIPSVTGELVNTNATQNLSSKTLTGATLNNTNLTGATTIGTGSVINLNSGYIQELIYTYGTLSSASTNTLFSTAIQKANTTSTASTTTTIALPSISSSNSGMTIIIFITMNAAGQTIAWINTKIAGSVTASVTANSTDIYSAINDGTSWYLTQIDKGFV